MIAYHNGEFWAKFLLRMNGSVFCTVFPMAIMSAGFGVGLYIIVQSIAGVNSEDDVPEKGPFYDPRDPLAHFKKPKCGELQSDGGECALGIFTHPFSVQSLTILFGYVLVLRTNIAVSRYMEGIDQLVTMTTKWIHAFEFMLAFDRVSERLNGRHAEHIKFRQRLLHHFSLMSSVALRALSEGDDPEFHADMFKVVYPEKEDFTWKRRLLTGVKPGQTIAMVCTGDFHIFNKITEEEEYELSLASDRTALISMWICEDLARASRTKLISTPPPIVARAYQEISNGMLGLNQAAKILVIQFPFPFAQMLAMMSVLFTLTTPFIVAFFTIDWGFSFLMIMTLGIGYYGCNEIAKEVEEPYGSDKNDLPLDYLQQDFVDSLRQVYMASCAPIPDTYDALVQCGPEAGAGQAPTTTPELRVLEAELARHGVPNFPKTFTHDDILAFPLTAWTTKVGDADLAQYLYVWVRSQK